MPNFGITNPQTQIRQKNTKLPELGIKDIPYPSTTINMHLRRSKPLQNAQLYYIVPCKYMLLFLFDSHVAQGIFELIKLLANFLQLSSRHLGTTILLSFTISAMPRQACTWMYHDSYGA